MPLLLGLNMYAYPHDPESWRRNGSGCIATVKWNHELDGPFGMALVPLLISPFDAAKMILRVGNQGEAMPNAGQVTMSMRQFSTPPTEDVSQTLELPWPSDASEFLLMAICRAPNSSRIGNKAGSLFRLRSFVGQVWSGRIVGPPIEDQVKAAIADYMGSGSILRNSVGVIRR